MIVCAFVFVTLSSLHAEWCVQAGPSAAKYVSYGKQCGFATRAEAQAWVNNANLRYTDVIITGSDSISAEELDRRQRKNEANELAAKGSDAWDRRDWEAAISYYQQAADIYPEEASYL